MTTTTTATTTAATTTTATTTAATTTTTTATVFRRAVAAEWIRLTTVRSTWCSLAAGAALLLLIGAAAGLGHSDGRPAPIWAPAQMALVPGQFAFVLIVLLAITSDYGTGGIRNSLLFVPRRGVLFATRLLVPAAFAAACAVVVAAMAGAVAWVFVGDAAEVVAGDIAASLGRVTLVVAFGGVLATGLGFALRSTAAALTALFLLMFVLVIALGNSGVRWLVAISDHLPGRAVVSLLVVDEVELTAGKIALVIVTWTVAVLAAGAWSLLRRDPS